MNWSQRHSSRFPSDPDWYESSKGNFSMSPGEDNSEGWVSIPDNLGAKAVGMGIPTCSLREYLEGIRGAMRDHR